MKLKKIASLMLAGVMAASMLAGCQNTNVKPEDPEDPIDPGTNGVSAAVGALIADVPEYVTFKDSSDLDADLQYAVEFAGVMDVMPQYVGYDKFTDFGQEGTVADDIVSRLQGRVTDKYDTTITFRNIGDNEILKAAEMENTYKIGDEVTVAVRAVSSAIGENAVNQMTAEMIDQYVQGYLYSTRTTGSDAEGGNYNHTYTVSVSTYTKAVNSSNVGGVIGGNVDIAGIIDVGGVIGGNVGAADPAVTFVAVQVVRTSKGIPNQSFLLLLIAPKQKNFCVTKDRVPLRGWPRGQPRIVYDSQ